MASSYYERLSALDNSFLLLERPNAYMHVASTQVYDAGPLALEGGGIQADAIKKLTAALLFRIPRYRQKLEWIPFQQRAVWRDDEKFNLDYHIRHTALPRPGTEAQLKRLSARIMQQHLDRNRPLWEMWIVEGLEGNRFAIISKAHHCMIDGVWRRSDEYPDESKTRTPDSGRARLRSARSPQRVSAFARRVLAAAFASH